MEVLPLVLPLLFAGVVFTIIYFIIQKQLDSINRNFLVLAERFNLDLQLPEQSFWGRMFMTKYPELHGLFEEQYNLKVYMFVRGSGKSKKIYTAFSLLCKNPRQQSLKIHREGILQKVGKAIGMQGDIELRDEEFDKRYIVKSEDSLFVKELFADPAFREFFIKYDYAFAEANLRLERDSIEFQRRGILNSEFERKRLVVAIRLAVKIAERLEEMG
jgi:hypothetical protein